MRRTVLVALVAAISACGAPQVSVGPPPEIEEVDARSYDAFLRARLLADLRYWEEAAGALREAIDHDPQAPLLYLELARALQHVDDALEEGLLACDLAADLGASPADVLLARAWLLAQTLEPERAIEVLRLGAVDAARADVFETWIALESDIDGDPALAARAFTETLSDDAGAWRALAITLRDSDPLAAAEAFEEALQRPDPEPFDAYERIGLLAEAEEWGRAADAAAECREQFWEYWPCTSWEAYLLDRESEAESPIDDAVREALSHLAFMVSVDSRNIGRSGAELRVRGRDELVREYATIVSETRPFNGSVVTSAAWIANGIGDYHLAIELMERVLVLDDANFDALNYIGYSWAELGENLDQAEVYIREALFLRGENGHMLDSLAWVLFRQGRFENSLEIQLEALELVDDNAILWDHLGDIYIELGDTDEAVDAWSRALDYADEFSEDVLEDAPRKITEHTGTS